MNKVEERLKELMLESIRRVLVLEKMIIPTMPYEVMKLKLKGDYNFLKHKDSYHDILLEMKIEREFIEVAKERLVSKGYDNDKLRQEMNQTRESEYNTVLGKVNKRLEDINKVMGKEKNKESAEGNL